MNEWVGQMALALVGLYVLVSIVSALRMYFVHHHYVHLEFAGKRWRKFGEWAPRQYRRLSLLRLVALLTLVAWLVTEVLTIMHQ